MLHPNPHQLLWMGSHLYGLTILIVHLCQFLTEQFSGRLENLNFLPTFHIVALLHKRKSGSLIVLQYQPHKIRGLHIGGSPVDLVLS